MKKTMALVLCVGLLSGSMMVAIMSPRRMWTCRPLNKNPQPPCSPQERATSQKWLVGGLATAIAAILAGLGIVTTVSEVRKQQEAAAMEGQEVVVVQPAPPTPTIEQKQAVLSELRVKLAQVDALIARLSPEQKQQIERAIEIRDATAERISNLELDLARQVAEQATR